MATLRMKQKRVETKKFLRLSLFAIIIVVFFILFKGTAGKINNALGVSFTEVRPSWSATLGITKQSLKNNIVFGTGPNTFLYNWLKFKPAAVNNTIFWNARFGSGFGHLPSMMATTGVLGIAAIIAFLFIFLGCGRKVFSRRRGDIWRHPPDGRAGAGYRFFLGAAYLWAFVIFTRRVLFFTMAFILTGVFWPCWQKTAKLALPRYLFPEKPSPG